MNTNDVRKLYAYNDWANDRILNAIAALSDEQFTRHIVSSYSSIRETLAHIAFAEWLWLARFAGERAEVPEWASGESFAFLRDQLLATAAERRAYLATLTDDAIDAVLHYVSTEGDPYSMPLADVLIHCANHSTYHRGQLVTMLRQAGGVPPNMDFNPFARWHRANTE